MSTPSKENIEEIKSELYAIINAPVGTPAMFEIDQELIPILTELSILGPHCQQHPTVKKLINWLVHPQRTVVEFNYVVGTLGYYVSEVMEEHFEDYKHYNKIGNPDYLGVAAAEALAFKCPILEGPWELAGWFVARLCFDQTHNDIPSECLSDWIIKVIGDANLCPNAHLRFELMCSLLLLVKIDKHNKKKITEAMMSACSFLNFLYLSYFSPYRMFSEHNYHCFYDVFVKIAKRGSLLQFGETLAIKLESLNKVKLASALHDGFHKCTLNPENYTEPWELTSLIAIIKTTADHARGERRTLEQDGIGTHETIDETLHVFKILLCKFGSCFQMPQLTCTTATFVMEVLDFVLISTIMKDHPDRDYWNYVTKTERLLQKLLTENESSTEEKSPIYYEIISRYSHRLQKLGSQFTNLNTYPTIYSIVYHT